MRFDKEYFESILPVGRNTGKRLWTRGLIQGEWCYIIELNDPDDVRIMVRSSIDQSGFSGGVGMDSIRLWLIRGTDHQSVLSTKVARWITRKPGWEERLYAQLGTLRKWRQAAGNCTACGDPRRIFEVKKGQNKGKIAATCCYLVDDFVIIGEKND